MPPAAIITVLGPIALDLCGITDAHNHLWIDPVPGADPGAPVLTGSDQILAELDLYRSAGGFGIIDCQPGGCGRNGSRLVELSTASGIAVVASTGFHRTRYYPEDFWLWSATSNAAADYFIEELRVSLRECHSAAQPARAGMIKVACEALLAETPQVALEGAAAAAVETGVLLQVHTEKGQAAETILAYFLDQGVDARQIVLCHMDKRSDRELHREIAQAGALLEYDTFYRPQYEPERMVWPLLEWMISNGYSRSIALATDMAETTLWHSFSKGPGLPGFITTIRSRLEALGASTDIVYQLTGNNITCRLAGLA